MKFHEFVEYKENNVLVVANEEGTPYNQEALKSLIKKRPKILQRENSYYKINLPSAKVLVVNEDIDKLSIFDICNEDLCKSQYKFKDAKGYVEWSDKKLKESQTANFYVNDQEGFVRQLVEELNGAEEPVRIYSVGLNRRIKDFLKSLNVELV